jgi:hypothetical protein
MQIAYANNCDICDIYASEFQVIQDNISTLQNK